MDVIKKEFCEALIRNANNISEACSSVGIVRSTFYTWMKNDPAFVEAYQSAKASLVDMGESALLQQVKEGNTTAIIFFLKTQAKDRGYGDQMQIEHSGIAIERPPTRATVKITGKIAGE